jgi:hypothetical protein
MVVAVVPVVAVNPVVAVDPVMPVMPVVAAVRDAVDARVAIVAGSSVMIRRRGHRRTQDADDQDRGKGQRSVSHDCLLS